MRYRCPDCRDTGRVTDRGRFYGDRAVVTVCPCQPRPEPMAADNAHDEADRLMAEAHPMEEEEPECSE